MVERIVKVRQKFCDKCGKQTEKYYSNINGIGDRPLAFIGLCRDCALDLEDWIGEQTPVVVNPTEDNTTTYGKNSKRKFKTDPLTLRELEVEICNLPPRFRSKALTKFAQTHPELSKHDNPMQYMPVYLKKLVEKGFLKHKYKSSIYERA